MMSFASWGNALYSGDKSYPIVPKRKNWLIVGFTLIVLSIILLGARGLNPSIEFSGGSQFIVSGVKTTDQSLAYSVLNDYGIRDGVRVAELGQSGVRVQTAQVEPDEISHIRDSLAESYEVDSSNIEATNIGPSWGGEVTKKAAQSLVIFLILVGAMMAVYFMSWSMSAAALFALGHDIFLTAGFFALTQVEVSPATVIGFLTILAYSLYDTVVVFDRVRELTSAITAQSRFTFAEMVNLAINQTLVRSINTSIVALLPVGAILFLGSFLLGAGTLTDISLALFVGMIAGTLSSVFIAPSMLVVIEMRRKKIQQHTDRVLKIRQRASGANSDSGEQADEKVKVTTLKPGRHLGQQAQPTKKYRKKKQ